MKLQLFLLMTLLVLTVKCDLPVHCTYSDSLQVYTWTFLQTKVNLSKERGIAECGVRNELTAIEEKKEFSFSLPNKVVDENGNEGTFNVFYDQGFQVEINGLVYLAYFNYTSDGQKTTSYCHETMTGLIRSKDLSRFGCFRAHRTQASKSIVVDQMPKYSVDVEAEYPNDQDYVDQINKVQSSWVAKTHSFLSGKTIADVQRMAGTPVTPLRKRKYFQRMATYEPQEKVNVDLPDSFDWRNVSGKSYVSPVRDQGSCGSCYSFATLAMCEARSLQAGKPKIYAPQDVVSCTNTFTVDGGFNSYFTFSQGCQGGFAFVLLQYGLLYGFNTEKCYPYQAKDTPTCSPLCNDRTMVKSYGYVGNYMGGASEAAIMEALVNEGPLSVNIMVYRDFLHYSSGVYHHTALNSNSQDPQEFIEANHLVLLVGFGELNGEKYWIIKNSWSTNWGMDGFGYILRGNSQPGGEIAIRSAVVTTQLHF